ncbi:MAG: DUF4410 domain-containing protein [Bacteroidales bacterium]|nr:DUF4410 domain-containing protein [Bacteroides sp.]MCM1199426.1 DUF4410 domain-containing protein [Clostridium sp.]MCM1501112.1 DUF4410 domain-containing protein [Bacteroidales bacterium]
MKRILFTAAILMACLCGEISAQKKNQPVAEGEFADWRGLMDYINIQRAFSINEYDTIFIAPVNTEKIKMPDKEDNTYEPTVRVLAQSSELSAEYMKKPFRKMDMEISAIKDQEETKGKKALIVNMAVDELDAGNRALRIWVGFGAGNAGVTMSGTVSDSETGELLISFRHRRIAPLNPSSHEKVLKALLKEVNEDLAKTLLQFHQ